MGRTPPKDPLGYSERYCSCFVGESDSDLNLTWKWCLVGSCHPHNSDDLGSMNARCPSDRVTGDPHSKSRSSIGWHAGWLALQHLNLIHLSSSRPFEGDISDSLVC